MLSTDIGPQIFISHARVDAQYVDSVARSVTTLGYLPWIDRQQLAGSQQWSQELQQAIAHSRARGLWVGKTRLRAVAHRPRRHQEACAIVVEGAYSPL